MGGKKGFTLVEVALSMGFIAVLSVTMILLINDTVATYRRGLTLNNVSTSGTELVNELVSAIKASNRGNMKEDCQLFDNSTDSYATSDTPTEVVQKCMDDRATNFTVLQRWANVTIEGYDETLNIPVYGAICTGGYSYIWNTGYFFRDDATVEGAQQAEFVYNNRDAGANYNEVLTDYATRVKDFRLLSVKDEKRAVCKSMNLKSDTEYDTYYDNPQHWHDNLNYEFNITNAEQPEDGSVQIARNYYKDGLPSESVTIVYKNDTSNPLALYDLTITSPASDEEGNVLFYTGSFVIGTLQGGINVKASGNFCKPPEGFKDEEFDYCAINKFNFAAQAGVGVT